MSVPGRLAKKILTWLISLTILFKAQNSSLPASALHPSSASIMIVINSKNQQNSKLLSDVSGAQEALNTLDGIR